MWVFCLPKNNMFFSFKGTHEPCGISGMPQNYYCVSGKALHPPHVKCVKMSPWDLGIQILFVFLKKIRKCSKYFKHLYFLRFDWFGREMSWVRQCNIHLDDFPARNLYLQGNFLLPRLIAGGYLEFLWALLVKTQPIPDSLNLGRPKRWTSRNQTRPGKFSLWRWRGKSLRVDGPAVFGYQTYEFPWRLAIKNHYWWVSLAYIFDGSHYLPIKSPFCHRNPEGNG